MLSRLAPPFLVRLSPAALAPCVAAASCSGRCDIVGSDGAQDPAAWAQTRGAAAQPSPEDVPSAANEFAAARAAHAREVNALRVKWVAEQKAAAKAATSSEAEERAARAAARKERQAAKAASKAANEKAQAELVAAQKKEKALRKEAAASRESVRRESIVLAQQRNYEQLLQSSRTWITEENLDARIEAALDHPSEIYQGYDVLYNHLSNYYPTLYAPDMNDDNCDTYDDAGDDFAAAKLPNQRRQQRR